MCIHRITINKTAFNYIKNGVKKIEGRLKKGYFLNNPITNGDIILFVNNKNNIKMTVESVNEFSNILACADNILLKDFGPNLNKKTDFIDHYSKFYSKKQLVSYPFLAINLEKCFK